MSRPATNNGCSLTAGAAVAVADSRYEPTQSPDRSSLLAVLAGTVLACLCGPTFAATPNNQTMEHVTLTIRNTFNQATAIQLTPTVAVTSAHFLLTPDGENITRAAMVGRPGKKEVIVVCTPTADYLGGLERVADISLCMSLHGDPLPGAGPWPIVNADASYAHTGELLLASRGCLESWMDDAPSYGTYVGELGSITVSSRVMTTITTEGGAVCAKGSSGGAGFVPGTPILAGLIREAQPFFARTRLVRLSDYEILRFIKSWTRANGEERICGIHAAAVDCAEVPARRWPARCATRDPIRVSWPRPARGGRSTQLVRVMRSQGTPSL